MGHRNIQFNNHMIEMQADQGHPHPSHLHPECIVYSNLPNYPHQNINFHPAPEQHHENPLFYAMGGPYNPAAPQHNLDLNITPPTTTHYNNNNPYLTPPAGIRDFPVPPNHAYGDGIIREQFKRKNAEGSSSNQQHQNAQVGPSSSSDVARVEASLFVGPDPVRVHNNANLVQGNYVVPPVQLPGNPWLDMNFRGNNGDIGAALGWSQPTHNLPYVHANANGACVESSTTGVQGYPVAAINRGAGFVHPPVTQSHPSTQPGPHMQRPRGYNVGHPSQMVTPSRGIPMVRYSNASAGPFPDVVEAGPSFLAPMVPTGFQIYRAHHGEIMLDPNVRHRGFPQLRVLPEDEVAMLEIPGYHVAGESIDQHRDMRLDIDHMSYEELLALGEQIGSVGTGLSEEFIQYNLRTRSFTSGPACINLEIEPCPDQETINFCVVCQMDYEYGESIGVLDCGHEYHKDCIKKWLVVKNTCPVCKSTALRGKGKDLMLK
ncbi:RING/U-box superfamily protein [Striga asiatica]|uniref:RING-type E3 ubiquitin transferase n=1 Tax=Striga asiatica TaxID=4170 RepID=A0A5A7RB42_STRAF|nr:RING/U-box superfamily protein [Striga asiatica]